MRKPGIPLIGLLVLLAPAPMCGQGSRGAISGIVRDSTGAVMPGVRTTVINEQTGFTTVVESAADGFYQARQLLPGNYTITVEHTGFKQVKISGLKLDVGGNLTQDLQLELGAVAETVVVSGQTNMVETTTAEVSTTVALGHVLEMPIVDRNVFTLINLTPGGYFVGGGQPKAYINGGRGWESGGMLDGVGNNRGGLGTGNIEMAPPVDSVQEFKVLTSNFSAEFGRSQGSTVSAVTKNGTNELHGSLYEFLRNDKFDAKGWGADTKAPLRRNNFGGTLGGPIKKSKAFFFYNYDGLRQRSGAVVTRNVGLPEWRTGDFSTATRQVGQSAAVVPIYDPLTGTGTPGNPRGNSVFPGNRIPVNRLDPAALKAFAYMPGPNRTPDNPYTQAGNWQLNRVNTTSRDYHVGRVDYEWNTLTKMFFRTFFSKPENTVTPALEGWGAADPNAVRNPFGHQNQALNVTRLFSPNFFGNFSLGYSRTLLPNYLGTYGDGVDYAKLLGVPNTPGYTFPQLVVSNGLVAVSNLGAAQAYRFFALNNWDFIANFTLVRGKHTMKFGAQHSRYGGNLTRMAGMGTYQFDGRFTRGGNATGAAVANTGISLADALLGNMISVAMERKDPVGKRIRHYASYYEDNWRVSANLTLNLGVRYETETPHFEVADRHAGFLPYAPNPRAGVGDIPANAIGVTLFQNRNGNGKYLARWDKNNVAPRFGFAYRLFGSANTSLRGGYGIYYGNPNSDAVVEAGNEPFGSTYSAAFPVPYRFGDGLPPGSLIYTVESELTPTWGQRGTKFQNTGSVIFVDPARVTPYSQNFNLTIQHQWKGILIEPGYRGNLGRHLASADRNINRIPPELLSRTDISERLRRPWTIFNGDQATVIETMPGFGVSSYHAFAFKLERRFSNGIGWLVAYTFSKQIDNSTYVGGTQIAGDNDQQQNFFDRAGERSMSTGSIPHRLVFSPILDLPFGKGRRWLNTGGVLNAVLGGWQVSAISTLQSGSPFGVLVLNGARDLLGDGAAGTTLRPNIAGELNSSGQGQPAAGIRGLQWLNPDAFANPARFTYGNAARTLPGVLGPGLVNFDTLLAKNFLLGDKWRAQFRWEMFNASNTPTFGRPVDTLGSGNFGVVTGASGLRIMQFGMKVYW